MTLAQLYPKGLDPADFESAKERASLNIEHLTVMPGKLTTHVLDTAHGCSAVVIAIALWQLDPQVLLKETVTNHDGRTDEALLVGKELEVGVYELVFTVGNYFAQYSPYPEPLFLDQIPIRFGISDREAHFIIAVKSHTKESILLAFEDRLENSIEREKPQALAEISKIARFRLDSIIINN